MKVIDWVNTTESNGGFEKLNPGFYVITITDVNDNPSDEFLAITWDVAEGDKARFYSDEWGIMNPWAHQFRRYYKSDSANAFSKFLGDVERSNGGRFSKDMFGRTGNERLLVGMAVGIALQTRYYTGKDGKDKEVLEVRYTLSADDVRTGNHKELPAPRDQRTAPTESAPAEPAAEYIPF